MLDRSRRTGPLGPPQLPLRGTYACRPRCIYARDNPVFDMLPFKFRSVFFWNVRRVQLAPGCRNEASAFSVQCAEEIRALPSALIQTDGTGQRSSLARMASTDFVQTKGLGRALCSAR